MDKEKISFGLRWVLVKADAKLYVGFQTGILHLQKMMIHQRALTWLFAIIHFANLNASSSRLKIVGLMEAVYSGYWPEVPVSTLALVRSSLDFALV